MGIVILVVIAVGLYMACRAAFRALHSVVKQRKDIPAAPIKVSTEGLVSDVVKSVWTAYEAPAFLRRGIGYPVLIEKKKKRVRKVKLVNTPEPEMALAVF